MAPQLTPSQQLQADLQSLYDLTLRSQVTEGAVSAINLAEFLLQNLAGGLTLDSDQLRTDVAAWAGMLIGSTVHPIAHESAEVACTDGVATELGDFIGGADGNDFPASARVWKIMVTATVTGGAVIDGMSIDTSEIEGADPKGLGEAVPIGLGTATVQYPIELMGAYSGSASTLTVTASSDDGSDVTCSAVVVSYPVARP